MLKYKTVGLLKFMKSIINSCYSLWTYDNQQLKFDKLFKCLPSITSILISSDGSCTKIIDAINNNITNVKPFVNYVKNDYSWRTYKIYKIYREKWLINKKDKRSLFAFSTYQPKMFSKHRLKNITPLGKLFINAEIMLCRRTYKIICLSSWWLEQQFKSKGYIWSRQYVFLHKNSQFITLHELFSPFLTRLCL